MHEEANLLLLNLMGACALMFVVLTLRGEVMTPYTPYSHMRVTDLNDLLTNECTQLKKILLMIHYERWTSAFIRTTTFQCIALYFLVYTVLLLQAIGSGKQLTGLQAAFF